MGDARFIAVIIVGTTAAALFVMERCFPLRSSKRSLGHRLLVNAIMSVLTYGAALLVVQPVAGMAMHWASEGSIGILSIFGGPTWLRWMIGFLLLDLSFYYWHRLNHKLPLLWRFHNIHHADPDLDVSTAFRFHFGEVALSALFRAAQALIIGVSLPIYAAYEVVFQLGTFFHHSNIRLPQRFESVLNFVLVTPRMHGIHHSNYHAETDSNYSVVFSVWDRLHKSFLWNIPQDKIDIGVPGYAQPADNQVKALNLMPFRKQRDYWLNRERRP